MNFLGTMLDIFAPVISWIFRGTVIKFVVMTAIFGVMAFLVPIVISYVVPFIAPASFTSAFSSLGSGVWYWLDFFNLEYGVPLLISAYITRFLIRRLPVIG
jgi:hypothetical protein